MHRNTQNAWKRPTTGATLILAGLMMAASPARADAAISASADAVYDAAPADVDVTLPQGDRGRLIIPYLDISVPLYDICGLSDPEAQAICDAKDSAAWSTPLENGFDEDGQDVIGDHKNQGFDRIEGAVAGVTKAYITRGDQISTYTCTAAFDGINKADPCLYNEDGQPINWENTDGFLTYTCLENWQHIRIVEWSPV